MEQRLSEYLFKFILVDVLTWKESSLYQKRRAVYLLGDRTICYKYRSFGDENSWLAMNVLICNAHCYIRHCSWFHLAQLYQEPIGLLIIFNFARVSKRVWLDNKNSLKHFENSLKQLALTVYGLIFGRAYYRKDFCFWELGGFLLGGGELIIGILR